MPVDVRMPAFAPAMEKGNVVSWLKGEGDRVRAGEVLAEIETDKAIVELESAAEGILARIVVPAGTPDVAVDTLLAIIATDAEAAAAPMGIAPAPVSDLAAAPGPLTRDVDHAHRTRAATIPTPGDGEAAVLPRRTPSRRIFASPLARRQVAEAGLDLGAIEGTGPDGRIVARDVQAMLDGTRGARPVTGGQPPAYGAAGRNLAADRFRAMYDAGSYEAVPIDGMRRTIAQRLQESSRSVPHFFLTLDCEVDALAALRVELNAGASEGAGAGRRISLNDCFVKAMAIALLRVPEANVVWAEDRLLKFSGVDISVAVATSGGLVTPVIRGTHAKSLAAIATEMADLVARARARRLLPRDYEGGTSTLSNLGMHGIRSVLPIINPPQGSILAIGAVEPRVVVRNNAPAVAQAMTVTLGCDHRVIDGAVGARLLAEFRKVIEAPQQLRERSHQHD
jgi:pyruvate dehydrogenase E2 component (dihydrolipoamide acetyltransferase)